MEEYLKQQLKQIDQRINDARKLLSDPELRELAAMEIDELQKQKKELEESSAVSMSDGSDSELDDDAEVNLNIANLEIRAAAGGNEAGLFASDLLRMYLRFTESKGWKTEELERSEGGLSQIKSVVIKITGKNAYSVLKFESGVHRVQRVPKTESSGRIHTSTATVAVLPAIKKSEVTINPEDIEFEAFRSGGAGGQNVNKVNTDRKSVV